MLTLLGLESTCGHPPMMQIADPRRQAELRIQAWPQAGRPTACRLAQQGLSQSALRLKKTG